MGKHKPKRVIVIPRTNCRTFLEKFLRHELQKSFQTAKREGYGNPQLLIIIYGSLLWGIKRIRPYQINRDTLTPLEEEDESTAAVADLGKSIMANGVSPLAEFDKWECLPWTIWKEMMSKELSKDPTLLNNLLTLLEGEERRETIICREPVMRDLIKWPMWSLQTQLCKHQDRMLEFSSFSDLSPPILLVLDLHRDRALGIGLLSLGSSPTQYPDIQEFLALEKPIHVEVTRCQGQGQGVEIERVPVGLAVHICILKNRKGAEEDIYLFEKLYGQLHCKVRTFEDPVDLEVLQRCLDWCKTTLKETDNKGELKYNYFVLYVSAHGQHSEIRLAGGKTVNIYIHIMYQFDGLRFPEFQGRQKLMVINACQRFENDETPGCFSIVRVLLPRSILPSSSSSRGTDVSVIPVYPTHGNFLLVMSTSPGFYSMRNEFLGTRFMRANVAVFMNLAWKLELVKLWDVVSEVLGNPMDPFQHPQLVDIRKYGFTQDFYFRP